MRLARPGGWRLGNVAWMDGGLTNGAFFLPLDPLGDARWVVLMHARQHRSGTLVDIFHADDAVDLHVGWWSDQPNGYQRE